MENKKDIGKAFREKLDGLHKTAPDAGWDSVSAQLRRTKMPSKFPWFRISVISLMIIVISLIITYPLWNDYMKKPDKENTEGITITPEKQNNEAEASNENTEKTNNSTPESTHSNTITVNPASTQPAPIVPKADYNNVVPARSARDNPLGTVRNNTPVAVTNIRDTAASEKTTTKVPGEEGGTFKIRDLSEVTYGTDSLKPNKKMDFRKIADSLDKVYGRERKGSRRERNKS